MIHVDTRSAEAAWQPFVDWLGTQGVNASLCYAVDIDPEAMSATVYEYATRAGRKYVKGDDIARAKPRTLSISSLPPMRSTIRGAS